VLAVGATATAVIAANQSHPRGTTKVLAPSPASSVAPLASGSADQLTWRTATDTSGLYMATSLSAAGSDQYAVSTGPGLAPTAGQQTPSYLYRSTDGSSWTVVKEADSTNSLAYLASSGGTIYAVGTGTASAGTGSGVQSVSVEANTNGGSDWQGKDLPLDLSAPDGALTAYNTALSLAVGPSGAVAVVGINADLDVAKLLPGVKVGDWTATSDGVDLLGARNTAVCGSTSGSDATVQAKTEAQRAAAYKAGGAVTYTPRTITGTQIPTSAQLQDVACFDSSGQNTGELPADQAFKVTGTYSWSSLGLSPQAILAVQGEPIVFYAPVNFYSSSSPGFRQVDLPVDVQSADLELTSGPSAFALVAPEGDGAGPNVLLTSSDGQTWTAGADLPASSDGNVDGLAYLEGNLVATASGSQPNSDSEAYTLDGDAWSTADVPCQFGTEAAGPLGIALVGTVGSGSEWAVCFSPDGTHWSTTSLQALVGGAIDSAQAVVTDDAVVVTVTRPPSSETLALAQQVALVGTLTGQ
jgi:hypothetical protein